MSLSTQKFFHRHQFQPNELQSIVSDEHFGIRWNSMVMRLKTNAFFGGIHYSCPKSATLNHARFTLTARFQKSDGQIVKAVYSPYQLMCTDYVTFSFGDGQGQSLAKLELKIEVKARFPLIQQKITWDFGSSKTNLEDVVLKVEDKKFHVSKTILATHSSYFNAMFFGSFRESKESEIELKEIDPTTFQQLLQVLYHCGDINEDNVDSVSELADMYDMKPVIKQCTKFLENLDKEGKEERMRWALGVSSIR